MATLYSYMDSSGHLIEVEEVMIPGVGLGVAFHTTHREPYLPLEEVLRLANALIRGLHIAPAEERRNGANDNAAGAAQATATG